MTTELVEQPNNLLQKPATLLEQAKTFVIVTNEDRQLAELYLEELATAYDKRFAYLDPPRAKAYEDYKYHKDRLDDAIDGIDATKKGLKQKCISWDKAQERIRQEAQRKAEEEAKKREEDQKLADALAAEQSGDTETAEAILEEPIAPPPVIIPKTAPKASRLSAGRTVYYAEVTNLMELCKAIVEKRQPISLIEANMVALNKLASALKSTMAIPGVVAKSKTV